MQRQAAEKMRGPDKRGVMDCQSPELFQPITTSQFMFRTKTKTEGWPPCLSHRLRHSNTIIIIKNYYITLFSGLHKLIALYDIFNVRVRKKIKGNVSTKNTYMTIRLVAKDW